MAIPYEIINEMQSLYPMPGTELSRLLEGGWRFLGNEAVRHNVATWKAANVRNGSGQNSPVRVFPFAKSEKTAEKERRPARERPDWSEPTRTKNDTVRPAHGAAGSRRPTRCTHS
jgi:hypothetical protein